MIAAAGSDSVSPVLDAPLPPSERDFQVYRRTAVEGATTREAAEEFGLSQTRIMQIRQRVFQFVADHLPRMSTLTREQRVYMAEGVAYEQLQHQYEEAMTAWRRSQKVEYKTKQLGLEADNSVTMIRESQGDVRYLQQALRVSRAIGRTPLASLLLIAPEVDAVSSVEPAASEQPAEAQPAEVLHVETPLAVEPTIEHAAQPATRTVQAASEAAANAPTHPEGDCSKPADSKVKVVRTTTPAQAAKPVQTATSNVPTSPKAIDEEDAMQTVQAVFNRLGKRERKELRRQRRALLAELQTPASALSLPGK